MKNKIISFLEIIEVHVIIMWCIKMEHYTNKNEPMFEPFYHLSYEFFLMPTFYLFIYLFISS